MEIRRLKLRITELEKLVEQLQSAGPQVVERIIEKPVIINQEPGSDLERDVSEHEEADE